MSIFSTLKTYFEKIKILFKKFSQEEPTWAQIAETDIAFGAPIVENIVTLVGGATLGSEVTNAITLIKNDLAVVTKFIKEEDSSSNLSEALETLKANFTALLSIAAIKNSAKVTEITAYVNTIIGEIEAILTLLPSVKTTTTA